MMNRIFNIVFILVFANVVKIFGQIPIKDNQGNNVVSSKFFCEGEIFSLNVNASATSSENYTQREKTLPNVTDGVNFVPFLDKTGDNKFSQVIDLGFEFDFFGQKYRKVVVGGNGRLVFSNSPEIEQLSNSSVYLDRTFANVKIPSPDYNKIYKNDPQREFPMAQIFAGYTDLKYYNANDYNRILYKKIDNFEGKKAFQISFKDIREDYETTMHSRILLLEDGRFFIQIVKKENKHNSILGIQNEQGTKAEVLPEYNNEKWKKSNVAYEFTPSKKVVKHIKWFVNNIEKYEGERYDFQPINNTEKLKVVITYDDNSTETSEEITFNKIQKPTFTATKISNECLAGYFLEIDNPQNIEYRWYRDGVLIGNGTKISVNQSGNYFVIANNCPNAKSDAQNITIQGDIPSISLENNHIFSECGTAENYSFNLQNLVHYPLDNSKYSVKFFDKNNNEIANPLHFVLNSGQKEKITIKVKSNTSTCEDSRDFYVEYQQLPANGTTLQVPNSFCFRDNSPYDIARFKADFPQYKDLEIRFSTDNIHFDLTEISPQQTAYVKISKRGNSCDFQGKLAFQFEDEIILKSYSEFPEHCFSQKDKEYFDLNQTKQELEYGDVKARFFLKYENGVFSNEITNLHYRGSGTIYIKLENAKGCVYQGVVPTLELKIYRKPDLIKKTPEQKKTACDGQIFDLTTNIRDYIGNWNRYAEIRYYDGNHNLLTEAEWENYDPKISGQPYMLFVYNSTNNLECLDTITFDLQYITKPKTKINQITICEETSYSLEEFKKKVVENPDNYQFFTEDASTELSQDIVFGALPYTFKFVFKDKVNGCLSDIQEVIFVQGNPMTLINNEVDFVQCDTDFDGKMDFNLDSQKSKFTNDTTAIFEYFSDEMRTKKVQAHYHNTSNLETIFVKISSSNSCPNYGKINLKVNTPTKSTTLQDKYYICYGNSVEVDAGSENVDFQWNNEKTGQKVKFEKVGKYSVILTNSDGCSYTHYFEISDENQPKIKQINTDDLKIEVIAEGGSAPYEYSFDGGISWQNSPILLNPTKGNYTIQVRANGCLGEPKTIYNVQIYNLITPNDDGKNDTWKVENLDKMEQVEITIVDRFGKVVFQSNDKNQTEWNGKINGRPLPTATYWYVVKWTDPSRNKTEIRQGWILLKNRE